MTTLSSTLPLANGIPLFLRLLDSTPTRDKLTKAMQYSLKILIDITDPKSPYHKKFSNAQAQISAARKVFRFFKFLSVYTSLIKLIDRISTWKRVPNAVAPYMEVAGEAKTLCMSLYLFYDTINWAGKAELLPQEERPYWCFTQKNYKDKVVSGYKFWMYSTIIAFVMDVVKIWEWYGAYTEALRKKAKPRRQINNEMVPVLNKHLRALLKDSCDILVSTHFSGYWNPRQRWIGLFGTISAIAGGWDAVADEIKKSK